MKYQCAWCGTNLGPTAPVAAEEVSHGICLPCAEAMLADCGEWPELLSQPPPDSQLGSSLAA